MLERIRGWLIPLLALTALVVMSQGAFAQEAAEAVPTLEEVQAEVDALNEAIPEVLQGEYSYAVGEDDDGNPASVLYNLTDFKANNLWIMIAGMLVFIMHLGFACVESGLTRAKNTVNILFKNVMIVMIGIVMYALCGWAIMYPGEWIVEGVFAFGTGIGGGGGYYFGEAATGPDYNPGYTVWTDFFFQAMFAATCCTIVSGAVAGRVKLLPFLIFCIPFAGVIYCIVGSWHWGGGRLAELGFADFAGSTLVHGVGGAGALACAIILGPRLGKFAKDGSVQPIPGHSMPLATIGVFLLWFGWFGFNGGSELSADPAGVSYVLVTTTLAACGGGLAAAIVSWVVGGKPDLTMALNGILAGLVGITAGPDTPHWIEALVLVGGISGVLVYFSVVLLDQFKIDDPVGAISVHGTCGIYGTLCCGLWGVNGLFAGAIYGDAAGETAGGGQLVTQAIGTVAGCGFAFFAALVIFGALNAIFGVRVSEAEEIEGLDLGEHDMSAYPDFQFTYIKSYHAREI
ncbi:ammonium transporter [Mucisphaera calidilacus]|uniref:Ammonium transporter n=1 Tax=Mucisphaera calidilacus TaxID=2527982 RepID=A0A518C0H4_9BACT|nr:ammonium transporter [Mucisphaera calidilacus]QDU72725.1 Ammonia channel precursor [Mucisphaera calidilacus]